jgi:hypothetical protein
LQDRNCSRALGIICGSVCQPSYYFVTKLSEQQNKYIVDHKVCCHHSHRLMKTTTTWFDLSFITFLFFFLQNEVLRKNEMCRMNTQLSLAGISVQLPPEVVTEMLQNHFATFAVSKHPRQMSWIQRVEALFRFFV